MIQSRHLAFWLLTFFVLAALLWLLHDVLLPFVLGMALAYVQAPIADRMERLGINRTVAALLMVSLVVVALVALVLLLAVFSLMSRGLIWPLIMIVTMLGAVLIMRPSAQDWFDPKEQP